MTGELPVSRRKFLTNAIGLPVAAAFSFSGCKQARKKKASAKQLNIQNWADYIHPDVIPEFERRYGIRVVYDTFASNEGLLAKMQAGSSEYDLVVPTGYTVRVLKKLDKLMPIDKERLPNFKYLIEHFQNPAYDPHCEFSLPYTWGSTGIGYNQSAFKSRSISAPNDWDIFWDKRLSGRMTLLDESRETIGMSLRRLGYSYNSTNEPIVRQACAELIQQKQLIMAYTSDQVIVHLASGDSLASLVYSGDAYQAARANKEVKYVIPRNGTSIWVDSWCIPKAAPHIENAYLWLNFMLEPEIAAKTASYIGYATPNESAFKYLDPELLADKNLYPSREMLTKCEEIADIGQSMFFYDRMWTELKCA